VRREKLSLEQLPGLGKRRAAELARAGHETLEDLLYHFPFRYEDRSRAARVADLAVGGPEATVLVTIRNPRVIRTRRRGFTIFETLLEDASGACRAIWYNQPYLARQLVEGRRLFVYGRKTKARIRREPIFENPDWELTEEGDLEGIHTGRIVPVYRKLATLGSRMLRKVIHQALEVMQEDDLAETLPASLLARRSLPGRLDALREVHFPERMVSTDPAERTSPAFQRLALEEAFLLQLAFRMRRQRALANASRPPWRIDTDLKRRMGRHLPFTLTAAQQRVLQEIVSDLQSDQPMYRMLQGDVGSGKTVVAFLAMLMARANGRQAALLAPTEILAEQHRVNFERFLGADESGSLGYLVGSLGVRARRPVLEGFLTGARAFAVGTHALFEPGIEFQNLGLVVVDEQHRFGVAQREALVRKGQGTDVLVMTATPIPRSLALTVWGDLDISVIDELPPGRRPIRTVVRRESGRDRVYEGLRSQLDLGRQAYIVVPRVEEGGKEDLKAATHLQNELQKGALADYAVGLLHGRLKSEEKDKAMQSFVRGETQVLVATTVIEVGVDVPNASVMIIEHADRFGLAQLHQLRGRVGRGTHDSYCVLMAGEEEGLTARQRLSVLETSSDGFEIAEADLRLRGPGAVFGTAQSGLSDLQFLHWLFRDPQWIESARRAVDDISDEQAKKILAGLRPGWRHRLELAGVG
jgi:ATP-dependent DNA helicase RecG